MSKNYGSFRIHWTTVVDHFGHFDTMDGGMLSHSWHTPPDYGPVMILDQLLQELLHLDPYLLYIYF